MASIARRALRWALGSLPLPAQPAILMYHRVADEPFDPWGLAVSPQNFQDQIEWLQRHRTILSLAQFTTKHLQGALPPDAVALTFDDGYECNATMAAPFLEKLRLPATIFIAPDLIRSGETFWWDELKHLVLNADVSSIRLGPTEVQLGNRSPRDWQGGNPNGRTQRQRAFYEVWSRLRLLEKTERDHVMRGLRGRTGDSSTSNLPRLMTPEETRSVVSGLIEIGSHGLSHARLPGLTAEAKRREIMDSVEACEAIVGTKPRSYCYAFGEFDAESEALVEASGFDRACATGHRLVSAADTVFAFPRIHVWNRDRRWLRRELAMPAF